MTPREKIKTYRQLREWTQSEAAKQWGISQSHLSDIERGIKPVGPWVAHQIEKNSNGDLKNLWPPKAA